MQSNRNISLDVSRPNSVTIQAKQNDVNSRFATVTVYDRGAPLVVPADCAIFVNACRADGETAGWAGAVNADGTVTIPLTQWLLSASGASSLSVSVISEDEEKLTTLSFVVDTEPVEWTGDHIDEDPNYDILVTLIADTLTAKNATEAATAAAEVQTQAAQAAAERAESAARLASAAEQQAVTAAAEATEASEFAYEQGDAAEAAAALANTAAANAATATEAANSAATNASDAAEAADDATALTEAATAAATAAAGSANSAATAANTATANATSAATSAGTAATAANTAAASATSAAENAETKAGLADTAATAANAAADRADAAAEGIEAYDAKIGAVRDELEVITSCRKITGWIDGYYLNTKGTTVDVNSPVRGASWQYIVLECAAGDTFTVSGHGGSDPRLWAFADASYNVLSRSVPSLIVERLVITAPENAAYLILNSTNKTVDSYTGTLLDERFAEVENDIADEAAAMAAAISTVSASIPTAVSDLTNDAGYITSSALAPYALAEDVPTTVSELSDASDYALVSDVPTTVAELSDASDYALAADVPTKTSDLINDADFVTGPELVMELSDYAKIEDVPEPYVLPTAASSTLGGVKVSSGEKVTTNANGQLTANEYVLSKKSLTALQVAEYLADFPRHRVLINDGSMTQAAFQSELEDQNYALMDAWDMGEEQSLIFVSKNEFIGCVWYDYDENENTFTVNADVLYLLLMRGGEISLTPVGGENLRWILVNGIDGENYALESEIPTTVAELSDSANYATASSVNDLTGSVSRILAENIMPVRTSGSASSQGVTYTSDGNGNYTLNGTVLSSASNASFYTIFPVGTSDPVMPDGVEAGKTYKLLFFSDDPAAGVSVSYKPSSGDWTSLIAVTVCDTMFTIPADAVGVRFRLYVGKRTTDHTVSNMIFSPRLYAADSIGGAKTISIKAPRPLLSIVYDDGHDEFKTYVLPVIQAKHVPIATAIVPSAINAGTSGFMGWDDVKYCYVRGAEVLSHFTTHNESEWNTIGINGVALDYQASLNDIRSHGFPVPPALIFSGGSAGYATCRAAARLVYKAGFNAATGGINFYGAIDPFNINRYGSDNKTLAEIKAQIDALKAAGTGWLVLTRHNSNATQEDPTTAAGILADAIDYAIAQGIDIVTVERGLQEYLDF